MVILTGLFSPSLRKAKCKSLPQAKLQQTQFRSAAPFVYLCCGAKRSTKIPPPTPPTLGLMHVAERSRVCIYPPDHPNHLPAKLVSPLRTLRRVSSGLPVGCTYRINGGHIGSAQTYGLGVS